MSANLKSGNAAVRFLLSHGEKLGMAVIVVCAVLLLWSGIGRERLDDRSRPEDLQNLIQNANTHMQKFRWDDASEEDVLKVSAANSEAMKPILHEHYPAFDHDLNRRVLDPVQLRTDPELLALLDLEVYGDSGILATSTPESRRAKELAAATEADEREKKRGNQREARGGGLFDNPAPPNNFRGRATVDRGNTGRSGVIVERPRSGNQLQGLEDTKTEYWATIVARIPIKKQNLRYQDAVGNSRGYNPNQDSPRYRGYRVYRAEVTNRGDGPWKKIAAITANAILNEQGKAVSRATSLVNRKYNHPLLTYPLPTLLLREWDKRITHSEIPLLADEEIYDPEDELTTDDDATPTDEDDLFGSSTTTKKRPQGAQNRGRGLGGRGASPMLGGMRGLGMGRGGPMGGGEMMGMGSPMAGGRSRSAPAQSQLTNYVWDGSTEYLLFRYVDRSVTPGKQYRYKIQLILADVNDGVEVKHLDPTVMARRKTLSKSKLKFRSAPESEPSPVVSIPLSARIYIASAKPVSEKNFNSEPEAELLVKSYEGEIAVEAARTDFVKRGKVVNLQEEAIVVWASKFDPDSMKEFNFQTGITLLDFTGGEKLSRKNRDLTAPTRAVLMDVSGRMFMQSEIEDYETVAAYQAVVEGGANNRDRGGAGSRGMDLMGGEGLPGLMGGGEGQRGR